MSHRLPLTISLENGENFDCQVVVEDDIVSNGFSGRHYPGVVELEVPPALHRKTFTDEDDEDYTRDISDLEEIILFAINEGGVDRDDVWESVSFALHGDVNDEPEPNNYYLVGDLVEHLFDSTPEQAVEKGAFLFTDEVQAKAFAMASPGLTVHDISPDNIEPGIAVDSIAESFIDMAQKKMSSDYQDGVDVNLVRKNAQNYFPDALNHKIVDAMVSVMVDTMEGIPKNKAIERHVSETMNRQLLAPAASKLVWQTRTTVPGRDIEKHMPNTPASAKLVSEIMNIDIDGNAMRGTMLFYQRPNSYIDRNNDEKPLVPVAFLSPDETGDYVVLKHPSITELQDEIMSQRVGMEHERGPENSPLKPKVSH
tara:strand:- start:3133 stop:4236 length:1104 start_codon:yes stop_codon:yes gene_type:complete